MRQILFTTALMAVALTSPALAEDYKVILKCTDGNEQDENDATYIELDYANETMRVSLLNEAKDGLEEFGLIFMASMWGEESLLFVNNDKYVNPDLNYFKVQQGIWSLNRVTGELITSCLAPIFCTTNFRFLY